MIFCWIIAVERTRSFSETKWWDIFPTLEASVEVKSAEIYSDDTPCLFPLSLTSKLRLKPVLRGNFTVFGFFFCLCMRGQTSTTASSVQLHWATFVLEKALQVVLKTLLHYTQMVSFSPAVWNKNKTEICREPEPTIGLAPTEKNLWQGIKSGRDRWKVFRSAHVCSRNVSVQQDNWVTITYRCSQVQGVC